MWHATVERDSDGLPYVPGTTLTGVLRDAALTVARALDDGAADGTWQRWHRYLFGDAGDREGPRDGRWLSPAAAVLSGARLPAALRHRISRDRHLVEAATFTAVGVKIDPETGRAADDHLFFVERARGGLPLRATLHLSPPDTDAGRTATSALLVLGAAWCESLGGQRRRGSGRVTIRLGDHDPIAWARWLAESGFQPPPAVPSLAGRQRPADLAASRPTGTPSWQRIDLTITLRSPVRVQRQVVGNSTFGHDHLPGSVLLAWLSRVWGAPLVREAVASESLLVRHAYPDVNGERGLPVPYALHRDKSGDALRVRDPGEFTQVRNRWTRPDAPDGRVVLQIPGLRWRAHNTVDRATQRPDGDSGLYSIEVIPAGRVLRVSVLVKRSMATRLAATHGERWWQPLTGTARFGARRRGEYGEATVDAAVPAEVAVPAPPSGDFTLLAVSDLLVRGAGLRYTADPRDLSAELAQRLGVSLTVDVVAGRTTRRDSWHRTWQLPRDSLVGLAAGTVLTVTPARSPDPERWQRLLVEGLGDRRVEGFGEVIVDPPLLRTAEKAVDQDPADLAEPVTPPPPSAILETNPVDSAGTFPRSQKGDGGHDDTLAWLRVVAGRQRLPDFVASLRDSSGYRSLKSAMARLSPSQRGQWLAVTADATLRDDPETLGRQIRHWRKAGNDRRQPQRKAAEQVARIDGFLRAELPKHGMDPTDRRLLAAAALALLDDVIDGLRRSPRGKGGGA
jgi:CRISPR-associated protein Csx10